MVQAGGSSAANARFAAVFAKQRTAVDRQWSATGGPAIPAIDAAMQGVMQSDHVRGAALALVWDKRLVLARGYTWAEPGYPVVQPTTLFRVASCSKTITAIAIHQLLFEKSLHLTDTMQSILNVKTPSGGVPADPRWSQITVRQLLEQNSGLITDYNWEDPQVAAAFNIQLPVSADQTVSYMATKMLKHDPGTTAEYSNFGYFLLGRIVAAKRGKSTLGDGLKSPLMAPLHITRLRSARSLISSQANDESRYFPPDLNLSGSVMSPTRPLVLNEYGNEQLEKGEGGGGLSVAVTDFARILAALNVTANNPMLDPSEIQAMLQAASQSNRGHGWDSMTSLGGGAYMGQKGGLLGSSQNSIYYVSGKLSFVVCWNHNPVSSGSWYPNFPAVVTAANAHDWGSSDLFPQYGMPSFA
jgi:CubicO group peptidase (beta-lactamase class C family)